MAKKGLVNDMRITLEGTCTMERVGELKLLLAAQLAATDAPAAVQSARIDLSQTTDIDACGCQLLALFAVHLRSRGIATVTAGTPDEIRRRIDLLGFSELLTDREAATVSEPNTKTAAKG